MGKQGSYAPGILRPAPEGFLDEGTIGEISGQGVDARRRQLLKSSFLGALATTLATAVRADGDPDILSVRDVVYWHENVGGTFDTHVLYDDLGGALRPIAAVDSKASSAS